tara:strand:+ start:3467 stop:4555 length:1089 start_codon:yes stop_codon:yes gene_type:complete
MNICLIGDGLTNLALAKCLVKKNINVSLYYYSTSTKPLSNRTLGISSKNYDFFNNQILNINKLCWPIEKIRIYNEKNKCKEILSFGENNKKLLYIFQNYKIYEKLQNSLKNKKNFKKIKIKNKIFYKNILSNNKFDIVINAEKNNLITKKIFYKKISKDYKSDAITLVINHQKCKNNDALQTFTSYGPLAFLPISKTKTSIVYSIYNFKKTNNQEIKNLILKYNKNYKIKSFSKFEKFKLKFSLNRNYFYKNIMNFGDNLHSIHPLAGQGFNMTIRDIKIFLEIIENNLSLGLPLDNSILKDFEIKTKHLNYIFSNGIDFIHEFFKFKSFGDLPINILKRFENNKLFKKHFIRIADKGFDNY